MISSTVVRSLYTGITTESSGSTGNVRPERPDCMETQTVPYAHKGGNRGAFGEAAVRRLAVIAPTWLGDAVMSLPAIADLRRGLPDATIDSVARPSVAPLF